MAPLGEYDYSLDGSPFQSDVKFDSVTNGSHKLTVRNTVTGCEVEGSIFNVNCSCPTMTV